MIKLGLYIHQKTDKLYRVTGIVMNATNAQDGQVMVEYYSIETGQKFVRSEREFLEIIDGVSRFHWHKYLNS
jgi:hypothetical protein